MKVKRLRKFSYPSFREGNPRSLSKSVVWRLWGIAFLALVTYIFTRDWITVSLITVCHHAIFVLVYFLHERFWNWTSWLRYSAAKPVVRMIMYETVLGNGILGLISFAFTGEVPTATAITLVYIGNKHYMYVVFDWLWGKTKWMTEER